MRQNKYDQNKDIDGQASRFIKLFNAIAKTEFSLNDEIKELLRVQLANGVTEKDVIAAVKNMRSSNDKNKFHKDTFYKFATPEYILKPGNINKYKNLKY